MSALDCWIAGLLDFGFSAIVLLGLMVNAYAQIVLVSFQLVVNTSRRSVKRRWGRHTTIVYPRFELHLRVNREVFGRLTS